MYHCKITPMSRAKGTSAVASYAYRVGDKVTDKRTGKIHDYTKKRGVLRTSTIIPNNTKISGADLWNLAELTEKKSNSRVAREITVNIPYKLVEQSLDEAQSLIDDFCKEMIERYGVAISYAIHKPNEKGDQRNFHAHIMMTTRKFELSKSKPILSEKSDIELSNTELKKRGLKCTQEQIKDIRKLWADKANLHLKRNGIDQTIDHRSYKEQGSKKIPTIKMGVEATAMERRGIRTEKGDINRIIKTINSEIEIKSKTIDIINKRKNTDKTELIKQRLADIKERKSKSIDTVETVETMKPKEKITPTPQPKPPRKSRDDDFDFGM